MKKHFEKLSSRWKLGPIPQMLMNSYRNLMNNQWALILIVMVWSSHNFSHVTTAELSWHVQNCELIRPYFYARARRIFLRFRLRTHKYFIKWISDCWSGSNRELCVRQMKYTNLCHAGFVWENMRLLLHFMSFIATGMVSRCWNLLPRKTNS